MQELIPTWKAGQPAQQPARAWLWEEALPTGKMACMGPC